MTEHSAVIFVFFFLAEYASIVLICILSSILFFGGYIEIFSFDIVVETLFFFNFLNINDYISYWTETRYISNIFWNGLIASLSLGIKSCMLIFVFIWARASFPRIRFDQLMSCCWTILLPIIIGFIIFIPCLIHSLALLPSNLDLL